MTLEYFLASLRGRALLALSSSFHLGAGNPRLLNQRLRRRRQRRRLRRTVWLLSWVAGLLVLTFVSVFGLWTALGQ